MRQLIGIMSFVMHELVYFGRSLPWVIIDLIPYFRRWKIQEVSEHSQSHLFSATYPALPVERWTDTGIPISSPTTTNSPQV